MTGHHDFTPDVRIRLEEGRRWAARVWQLREPLRAISSAPLGGGIGVRNWVLNVQVPTDYDCDDPQRHLASLAREAGLEGAGAGMMTAVDVRKASAVFQEGIFVDATIGVHRPQWAAAEEWVPPSPGGSASDAAGTINIVAVLPERLSEGALVNAVMTATEAKSQALWEAGAVGTGTATDALCILCPAGGASHPYGGPRSRWGSRLARAVHRAVLDGCRLEGAA